METKYLTKTEVQLNPNILRTKKSKYTDSGSVLCLKQLS